MKRFVLKSLLYSLPILIPVIIYCVFINPYLSGDIGPLGYITFPKGYADGVCMTNKVVSCGYNFADYEEDGILTIGDSFSQTNNRDEIYNYFMAESWDCKVYNLSQEWFTNPFNRFLYLSKTQKLPKIVVVESVERDLIERLNDITLHLTSEEMIMHKKIDTTSIESHADKKSAFEKTQEWIKRKMRIKGYENPIYHSKLIKPLFSCQGKEDDLYFYNHDVNNIPINDSLLSIATLKLDSLFTYADSIGIELYLLIAADKYDVYQDYIVANPYPKQDVLERLYLMYPHPRIINSKDTLSKMVANDVMDVYWCNNTHWSPIGAEAVALQVLDTINR